MFYLSLGFRFLDTNKLYKQRFISSYYNLIKLLPKLDIV